MKKLIVDVITNTSTISESNKLLVYKNKYGTICISAVVPSNEELLKLSNYRVVELSEQYLDCKTTDFNDDLTFNIIKYNTRKLAEQNRRLLPAKLKRLEELRKDIVQDIAGLDIKDIDARKEEYIIILNEVRVLQGKEPKPRKNIS